MKHAIQENAVDFENGKRITFEYPIREALDTGDVFIVCLDIPVQVKFNENVFGIGSGGSILWQVKPTKHLIDVSPYVGLSQQDKLVRLHNADGMVYDVEPKTGRVVSELLAR